MSKCHQQIYISALSLNRHLGQSMHGSSPSVCPIRLCGVTGYDCRINDIIYCHPTVRADKTATIVYFGGDVQDFSENMKSHRDNKNYLKWNLESTAVMLHSYFSSCHIVVVRPARMELKTFSCFDNFVPSNSCGAPDHTPMHFALQHLERLLQGVSHRLAVMPDTEILATMSQSLSDENVKKEETLDIPASLWWKKDPKLDKTDILLIGFSKGCVVLNQFLYEFHYLKTLTPEDDETMQFVRQIVEMYWLDGGHAGGRNTWITSRSLLETLTRLHININVHVTPYQIQDDRRPWIRKEEKTFSDLLQRLGATVQRTVHFENQTANLHTHFGVLSVFRQLA